MSMNRIIYLAKMLGLDENSKSTADFMAEKLKGVKYIYALIEYCEDHKEEVDIWKKDERFGVLVDRYKKVEKEQEYAKIRAAEAQNHKDIAERFAMIRNTVESYYTNYGKDSRRMATNSVTKKKLFTEEEIAALDDVGTITHQVELSQLHLLAAALEDVYMKQYIKKSKYQALTPGAQKVMGLLNG